MAQSSTSLPTRRRRFGRIAAAAVGAVAFVPTLVSSSPAGAATTVDWAGIGWSDTAASPQSFSDVFAPGVGMTVAYSGNMWDGVPNVYGGSAPIAPYAASLRFTNDMDNPDNSTTVTITFDAPVYVNDLRVGSLSELGSMWEWVEVTGSGSAGVVNHTAASISTGTYDTSGAYTTPGTPALTSVSSGNITARGTSRQGAGAPGYESVPAGYDNMHVDFGTTPITSIQLRHFATTTPDINSPRSGAFASVIVDLLDVEPVPVVAASDYDLALANVISSATDTSLTYDITVCNQGDVASGAFTVTDELAPGTSFTSATQGGTASGNIVTWNVPATSSLAPGACTTLSVTVAVNPAVATTASCVNTAEISSDSGDDVDSTPDAVLTGAGSDALIDILDASGLASASDVSGDEDDHDIARCTVAASTTAPTPTPSSPAATPPASGTAAAAAAPILPVTGTDTGGVAGLALVLLTMGGSLLFISERARFLAVRADD